MKLIKPEEEELSFRQSMLEDEKIMSYNAKWGGTISFPHEKWHDWYLRWCDDPTEKYFYRYLMNESGAYVGECAYDYDEENSRYLCDVIVHAKYRNKGYGREGLRLLLDEARKNGIGEIYDKIAADNPSLSLFLKEGFAEVSRSGESITVVKNIL